MDDQIEQLNSSNKEDVINAIREHIIEQYEKATGKKIENHEKFLPNEVIHTIIEAHTQP